MGNSWTQLTFPSFSPFFMNITRQPNGMHSFRGKPTIFGSTTDCNDKGECDYSEIIQYDDASDSWTGIGKMLESKTLMDVIEVPQSFCSILANTQTSTSPSEETTTDEGSGTTTEDPDELTTQPGDSAGRLEFSFYLSIFVFTSFIFVL